jgi:hypothetical protein
VKRRSAICRRRLFEAVHPELHDFAQEVRAVLFTTLETCASMPIVGSDAELIRMWAIALGTLMWNVSGSVLVLLSHGEHRAPVILNRCVFEYQLRLKYYMLKPNKARQAMEQMPERFRKILRANYTWRISSDDEMIAETEAALDQRDKIVRENIKDDMFRTVFGEDADKFYDGYYGEASGLVHGYETVLRDIGHEFYVRRDNPKVDHAGTFWKPNDAAEVLLHSLLMGLAALAIITGERAKYLDLNARCDALLERLEFELWGRKPRRPET